MSRHGRYGEWLSRQDSVDRLLRLGDYAGAYTTARVDYYQCATAVPLSHVHRVSPTFACAYCSHPFRGDARGDCRQCGAPEPVADNSNPAFRMRLL